MGKNIKHKDKERRLQRYNKLRSLGFTSKEANRYKDYSDYKIDLMIEVKEQSNQVIDGIARGGK